MVMYGLVAEKSEVSNDLPSINHINRSVQRPICGSEGSIDTKVRCWIGLQSLRDATTRLAPLVYLTPQDKQSGCEL